MDTEQSFSISTIDDLAKYNQIKLSLLSNLTKTITEKVISNIRSEKLPNELDNDFDIFIVETIKNKFDKILEKGFNNG